MQDSKLFDRIIVSTDSPAIANIAEAAGAEVPFMRPIELSDSNTNTIDVIGHALQEIKAGPEERICCVYATNPFLSKELLSVGLDLLIEKSSIDYVTPVTNYGFPIQRSLSTKNGVLTMTSPEHMHTHSQNLLENYHETAQFWWGFAKSWMNKTPMQQRLCGIYVPAWSQQDIDTEDDWIEAEIKYEYVRQRPDWPHTDFTSLRANLPTKASIAFAAKPFSGTGLRQIKSVSLTGSFFTMSLRA
jgi:pseudaminic acid cytidylyltransferase